jgi:hypothetical protein
MQLSDMSVQLQYASQTFAAAALGASACWLLPSLYAAGPTPESLSSRRLSKLWALVLDSPGCSMNGPSRGCWWGLWGLRRENADAGTACEAGSAIRGWPKGDTVLRGKEA